MLCEKGIGCPCRYRRLRSVSVGDCWARLSRASLLDGIPLIGKGNLSRLATAGAILAFPGRLSRGSEDFLAMRATKPNHNNPPELKS